MSGSPRSASVRSRSFHAYRNGLWQYDTCTVSTSQITACAQALDEETTRSYSDRSKDSIAAGYSGSKPRNVRAVGRRRWRNDVCTARPSKRPSVPWGS